MLGGCAFMGISLQGRCLEPAGEHPQVRHLPHKGGRMVFQAIGDEPLDTKVDVRLTSAEKARLQEDAEIAGMSMSALVRARYFIAVRSLLIPTK